MKNLTLVKFLSFLPIIISIILFDQISKYLVLEGGLATSCNVGFAFGIFPFSNVLSATLTIFVLVLVGILLARSKDKERSFGLILIFGGGLSNLIDRFTRGCVIDFLEWSSLTRLPLPDWFKPILASWPAFNLADAAITVGVGILIFSLTFPRRLK